MTKPLSPRLVRLTLALPHLVLCGLLTGLLAVAELQPRRFHALMQEDGWAEWATFLVFALAAGLGVARARSPALAKLERVVLLGLALFAAFVAGEEISWGQRLLGYQPPRLFLEYNFQQEANLHNLLKDVLDTRFVVAAIAIGYGLLLPFLNFLALVPRALAPALSLAPYFAAVAFLELSYAYELVGELAELCLGTLFLADIAQRSRIDQVAAARTSASGQLAALWGALALVPLNGALLELHREAFSETARAELDQLASGARSGALLREALFRKGRVHKRLYTAARVGYVALDPGDYALDPWNNPYWVVFRKQGHAAGKLLLYSFGPNHQRESDVEALSQDGFALHGDDLGVVISVSSPRQARR